MEDYKLMATPFITNMKQVVNSNLELVNIRLDMCFVVKNLIQFMVDSR
jgi:hypothetical protein